jgi:hypothetical protein
MTNPDKVWVEASETAGPVWCHSNNPTKEFLLSAKLNDSFVSCWNVGTTCFWTHGKKVPGSKRLVTRQVKRLVLSGVIPTIQQKRELFRAFLTLSIKKSDNVKKLNHIISCLVGMLERRAPGPLERKSLGLSD